MAICRTLVLKHHSAELKLGSTHQIEKMKLWSNLDIKDVVSDLETCLYYCQHPVSWNENLNFCFPAKHSLAIRAKKPVQNSLKGLWDFLLLSVKTNKISTFLNPILLLGSQSRAGNKK